MLVRHVPAGLLASAAGSASARTLSAVGLLGCTVTAQVLGPQMLSAQQPATQAGSAPVSSAQRPGALPGSRIAGAQATGPQAPSAESSGGQSAAAGVGGSNLDAAVSHLCEQTMDGPRFPDAKAQMRTMAAGADVGGAAFAQGCLLMAEQRFDRASDAFERAVKAAPMRAAYHFQLGQSYGARAQHANIFKQAMLARKTKHEFDRAVQLDPDLIDARVGLVSYYLLAPGLLGGSADRARAEAEEIRRRNPYRGGLAFAQIAGRQNDLVTAARELDALTRAYPDSAMPYVALATGYAQRKLWPEAWAAVDRLGRALPNAPITQYLAGRLAAESGEQLDRGAAGLARYVQTGPRAGDPPLATAHLRLGEIYERQAKREAARTEYETAVRLDPALNEAKQALDRLR